MSHLEAHQGSHRELRQRPRQRQQRGGKIKRLATASVVTVAVGIVVNGVVIVADRDLAQAADTATSDTLTAESGTNVINNGVIPSVAITGGLCSSSLGTGMTNALINTPFQVFWGTPDANNTYNYTGYTTYASSDNYANYIDHYTIDLILTGVTDGSTAVANYNTTASSEWAPNNTADWMDNESFGTSTKLYLNGALSAHEVYYGGDGSNQTANMTFIPPNNGSNTSSDPTGSFVPAGSTSPQAPGNSSGGSMAPASALNQTYTLPDGTVVTGGVSSYTLSPLISGIAWGFNISSTWSGYIEGLTVITSVGPNGWTSNPLVIEWMLYANTTSNYQAPASGSIPQGTALWSGGSGGVYCALYPGSPADGSGN